MAFASNPDKTITFSDEFNKLMADGNMFRGQYDGAFVTTIHSAKLPVAYFGKGYDNCFTIVHEFGHYMNEIYSADVAEENDEFSQSYDLLEMHSQGNELLYLCYLEENANMTEMAHRLVETHSLVNMLYVVMAGMTIDTFEQAVYLNAYEGTNADQIMADGKITYDEYNLLYTSICTDYGVAEEIGDYWQHGMTITSPCYYVSYSVSAISVLQLYEMAHTDGFNAAKDAYLKLFTYVDENPEMTMDEVLAYAGMLSYSDEELYVNLKNYMDKK
jgi:oligoendopeptidase F